MDKQWIVLANASRARIGWFDRPAGRWVELADFVHPASRQKLEALGVERGGHAQKDAGSGPGAGTQFAPRSDPRHKARVDFARELAAHLDEALAARRCQSWRLLASDPFLGTLKAELGKAAAAALKDARPLDLCTLEGPALDSRLAELSGPPA